MDAENKKPSKITAESLVEEIVERFPKAVGWLVGKGIVCMVCGEPFWGTIGELMKGKNIKNTDRLLDELNAFLEENS